MENPNPQTKWYYTLTSVLVGLLLLGPFAFPLLWRSPQFSRTWKVALTIFFTVATIYLIFATWQTAQFALRLISQIEAPSDSGGY